MKALITGITGQDGSYLADLLLRKNYEVYGLYRRSSADNFERLEHVKNRVKLIEGELCDPSSVTAIISEMKPDEVYNLAAQSHVGTSFEQPEYTFLVNTNGVLHLLEAIRRYSPKTRFYQASTSEMFGSNWTLEKGQKIQNLSTPFAPQSPYAVAKVAAHQLVRLYRNSYGLHASCGILFNHESPRRGENFVTRKITKWLAQFFLWTQCLPSEELTFTKDCIVSGNQQFPKLRLGNIDAYRDWGHAADYVEAMYLIVQNDKPDDYIISTGESRSVRDFLSLSFGELNLDYNDHIVIDPKFYRPSEVEFLRGDYSKAKLNLGWRPETDFIHLVRDMVWSDINAEKQKPQLSRSCLC